MIVFCFFFFDRATVPHVFLLYKWFTCSFLSILCCDRWKYFIKMTHFTFRSCNKGQQPIKAPLITGHCKIRTYWRVPGHMMNRIYSIVTLLCWYVHCFFCCRTCLGALIMTLRLSCHWPLSIITLTAHLCANSFLSWYHIHTHPL